ncbi:MAG: FecR family protein [Treponema sp.]|jgi:hypothetical protein|nr:FecR family protein [Treponema sp.]
MKRFSIFMLMLFIIVLTGYSQSTGIIRELTGDVELKHAGSSIFVPAQAGAAVAQDTIISTGLRSTAIIAVGNTTIVVRPITRLSLAEIQSRENAESLNVSLQTGRVRVEVKPPAGTKANATVQTPSATASVRGTGFEMDNNSLTVTDGKVIFAGNNGFAQIVTAGYTSEVDNTGSPSNPIQTAKETLMPSPPPGTSIPSGQSSTGGGATSTTDTAFEVGWADL